MTTERLTAGQHLSGVCVITPHDGGPVQYLEYIQCGHCGRHWPLQPGSGKRRGVCLRCGRLVCGNKRCGENCNSGIEAFLDLSEKLGRLARHDERPAAIVTSGWEPAAPQAG